MTPERFPASIKWSHADELEALCNRIASTPRYVVTAADAVLLGNLAGALNWARDQVQPEQTPVILGPIVPNATTDFAPFAAKQAYAYQATADGVIGSVGNSTGLGVWGHVGDTAAGFPFPSENTAWGGLSHNTLPIKAGQWYSFACDNAGEMRSTLTVSG